jgi:hypothetical protein
LLCIGRDPNTFPLLAPLKGLLADEKVENDDDGVPAKVFDGMDDNTDFVDGGAAEGID